MLTKIWVLTHTSGDIQSVNRISNNLSTLYLSLPKDQFEVREIKLADLEDTISLDFDFKKILQKYKEETPDHVAVVHPGLTNHIFLRALLNSKVAKSPQFIFHIFGNFVRYGESWFALNRLLLRKNVQLAVASDCYFELLTNFISADSLYKLPFPIDLTSTVVSRGNDQDAKERPFRVLYAGRYHEQKNVTQLIRVLDIYSKKFNRKVHLSLAVYFDDFNPTTINSQKILGQQFNNYSSSLKDLSDGVEVSWLPHQSELELARLYSTHDVFISLSTFLDEDYGNSIIESLSQGTPCIVSKWGGYKDFCLQFPDDCLGLDLVLEQKSFYLDTEKIFACLESVFQKTSDDRKKLKLKILDYVGQKKLHQDLTMLFSKKSVFKGFDQSLLNFSINLKKGSGKSFMNEFKILYKSFW